MGVEWWNVSVRWAKLQAKNDNSIDKMYLILAIYSVVGKNGENFGIC